jgi:Ca2+/Na+ antiporter
VDVVFQLALLVGGLGLALVASDVAVSYTRALAHSLGAPSFVVGVVLVALGTDLPEIANSIAAHLQDEGDVNVGDSVGLLSRQWARIGLLWSPELSAPRASRSSSSSLSAASQW